MTKGILQISDSSCGQQERILCMPRTAPMARRQRRRQRQRRRRQRKTELHGDQQIRRYEDVSYCGEGRQKKWQISNGFFLCYWRLQEEEEGKSPVSVEEQIVEQVEVPVERPGGSEAGAYLGPNFWGSKLKSVSQWILCPDGFSTTYVAKYAINVTNILY